MKLTTTFTATTLAFIFCASISNARSLKGTYEVPTNDPAKKGSNIHKVEFENSGDFMRDDDVRFILPDTLVGTPIEYKIVNVFRGAKDTWAGPGIENMECDVVGREYTCNVKFTPASITLDEAGIEKALKAQNPAISQESLMTFMSVSQDFADDPIGILRYEVRGKDREAYVPDAIQSYNPGQIQ